MEIRPNQRLNHLRNTQSLRKGKRAGSAEAASEALAGSGATGATGANAVDLSVFSELVDRLSEFPDLREEILAEARDLLNDPEYPTEEQLEALEWAIAQHRIAR